MKVIIFGFGSIGRRHTANLRSLRPDVLMFGFDPAMPSGPYANWRVALEAHLDVDAAIIASPTDAHGEQMQALAAAGIPFYVEKPLGTTQLPDGDLSRCVVGFQYRFHPKMPAVAKIVEDKTRTRNLRFYARDDLLGRYGPQVGAVMAAHPIDSALRLLGPAEGVNLHSNGEYLSGTIYHGNGALSGFDLDISKGPRESWASDNLGNVAGAVQLPADDGMYVQALEAWLRLVESGERDPRLATLADGLAVERVLAEVRYG